MTRFENSALPSDAFKHLWMPFTSYQDMIDFPPVVIERGAGIYLYDTTGKGYIDAVGSWWVSIFGHNHPQITRAVKEQLDKIEHVMMAGFISEPALRLSKRLGSMLPKGLSRIFYSDDGSTAVEVALKIALQYHALRGEKRRDFVSLDGGYHGDTLGAMSVGNIAHYHGLFHDRFKSQFFADSPYCYRCPAGCEAQTCSAECMDSLKRIFEERGENVAACIFEPMVQGAAGMRIYPVKVLQRIFALCKEYSVMTIADEVAMGLGRTGKLFACEHAAQVPDIMCLAKGLSGGYIPFAATVVKETVFQEFCGDFLSDRTFQHGHSFTGNPLAASAGCAALDLIDSHGIPGSLEKIMADFADQLNTFREFEVVGDVRTIGMCGAVEFVKNRRTKEMFAPEKRFTFQIARYALNLGLIVRPLENVIYFMPPYITSQEQLQNMIFLFRKALKGVLDEASSHL